MQGVATLAVAFLFAAVHVLSPRLGFLDSVPRSRWLSLAGGVSIAYVFVHLLPELAYHQRAFSVGTEEGDARVYALSLFGLLAFYSLERLARRSRHRRGGQTGPGKAGVFWLHLVSFALYNGLIGYLLVHREDPSYAGLVMYAVALGLHFVVNDRALQHIHGTDYRTYGRWILAAAVLCGWAMGLAVSPDPTTIAALFALLAGGVILNVLKEELPEFQESRIWAFLAGALGFSVLALAA
jgi:zinc transporter ZupT